MDSCSFIDLLFLLLCRWPEQQRCELLRHAESWSLSASSRHQHGHIYSPTGIKTMQWTFFPKKLFSWSLHVYHMLYLWPTRPTHAPLMKLKVSTESHYTFLEEMCFIWFRRWLRITLKILADCKSIRRGRIFSLKLTEACITWQRQITRSCRLGDTLTRSATFHALSQTTGHQEEGSPQQRRITVGESGIIVVDKQDCST